MKVYMIVNFRAREISRDTRKLARKPMLIKNQICYLLLYFVILNFTCHQVLVEFNQISSCHLPLLVFELGMKFIQQFWWLGLWFKKMVGIFYAKKMHLSPCFWKSQSSPSISKLIYNKSFPHKFSICFYFLSNDSVKHNYKCKIWKERFKVKDLIMNRVRDAGAKLKSLVKKLRLNYFFPRAVQNRRSVQKQKTRLYKMAFSLSRGRKLL
jgi:hypothetical protein